MKRLDLRTKIGIFFWTPAAVCFGMSLYGFAVGRGDLALAGFVGGAWFTLLASMPREMFIKVSRDD